MPWMPTCHTSPVLCVSPSSTTSLVTTPFLRSSSVYKHSVTLLAFPENNAKFTTPASATYVAPSGSAHPGSTSMSEARGPFDDNAFPPAVFFAFAPTFFPPSAFSTAADTTCCHPRYARHARHARHARCARYARYAPAPAPRCARRPGQTRRWAPASAGPRPATSSVILGARIVRFPVGFR